MAPAPIVAAKNYLVLANESAWGTLAGSPAYVAMPVDTYGVKFIPVNRKGNSFVGVKQRIHSRNYKGMPSGGLNTLLFGWRRSGMTLSLAEYLMTWAFESHEANDLASKSAEWADGPNLGNRRHLGLRVNQATLSGSTDQPITLGLELMGKDEVPFTTAQTVPNDHEDLVEFLFEHSLLTIDGNPTYFGGFQRQVSRNLEARYYAGVEGEGTRPSCLRAKGYQETLQLSPPREDDTWDDVVRDLDPLAYHEIVLTLKGLNNGTGTVDTDWTICTITWPKCKLLTNDVQGGRDDLETDQLNFDCLKPGTSANTHTTVWSEE
jgi:hypothetical protein